MRTGDTNLRRTAAVAVSSKSFDRTIVRSQDLWRLAMDLFCFASKNLTNIWAGVGARMWAVAETSPADMKARVTKSKRMVVGSIGVLYCNETHSFTTPFLVYSLVDPDQVVEDVWPERWRLPFK